MSMPDECKWCGCSKILSTTIESVYFGCLTRYCDYDGEWYMSDTCAHTLVHTAHTLRLIARDRADDTIEIQPIPASEPEPELAEIVEETEDIEEQEPEPQERPTIANSVRRMSDLRERIAKAVEAANQANRFGMVTEHGSTTAQPASNGCYSWASVLDDIALILAGSSPENQEGSP